MPRPIRDDRQFDEANHYARHGWAGVALASPMGLLMLAILLAGAFATATAPRQAGAETALVAVAPADAIRASAADRRRPAAAVDIRALVADPAIRDFQGLSENAWDFTDPNAVPGFGPLPAPCGECRTAQSVMR